MELEKGGGKMPAKHNIAWVLVIALIVSVSGWVYGVGAEGDSTGPEVSQLTPAPGSIINTDTSQFSLRFSDSAKLDSNVTIKIDGQALTPVITWDGLYKDIQDTCTGEWYQERIGDDYTKGVITAQLPKLDGGEHSIYYSLKDRLGNVTEAGYAFTVSDTQDPQISQQTPNNGLTITNPRPVITAKVSDNSTIDPDSVSLIFNGNPVKAVYDPFASVVTYAVTETLKNGTYTVYIAASDIFGNTAASSWSFTVNEKTPPVITGLTPVNGGAVSTATPLIEAAVSDASGITNPVYIEVDGSNHTVQYNQQTGKASYTPTAQLSQGQYTVSMFVYDFQGNKGSAAWTFSVEFSGPTVTELSPAPGSITDINKPQFSLRFNDSSQLDPDVTVKVDGQAVTPTVTWDGLYRDIQDTCTGEWYQERVGNDYTKGIVTAQLPELNNGEHTIYYELRDRVGNVTEAGFTFTVSDIKGPELSQQTPGDGAVISDGTPVISAKLVDTNGINADTLYLSLNGNQVNCSFDVNTGLISYQVPQLLPQGTADVELRCSDKLGNYITGSWSFIVKDLTGPQITSLSPVPEAVTSSFYPEISAKITDENGLNAEKVILTFNGNKAGSFKQTDGIVSYLPAYPLAFGDYTAAVSAYDSYGNVSSLSWNFYVRDAGPPLISELLPPPMMGTAAARPVISARVADSLGIDLERATISIDRVLLDAGFIPDIVGSNVSGTIYAVPGTDLSDGLHSVTVNVFDISGNSQQQSWQFGVNYFDMTVDYSNCLTCHEGAAAIEQRHVAVKDCSSCHGSDCGSCHSAHTSNWPPPVQYTPCANCHDSDTVHESNEVLHSFVKLGSDCSDCHMSDLTKEHNVYREGSGTAHSCQTCHQSTNPNVIQAISGHNLACTACHGIAGAGHEQYHQGTLESGCMECHISNISTEHLTNDTTQSRNLTCNTCHSSSDPLVQQAITDNNLTCNACHEGNADHETVHTNSLDAACRNCHSITLTADHITNRPVLGLSCSTCHDSAASSVTNAISTGSLQCAACHDQGHGFGLVSSVPDDIPLLDGVLWSTPMNAGIWAGEPWLPTEFVDGGKVVVSGRSNDISASSVWDFYEREMSIRGWSYDQSPALGSDFYKVTFTKGTRKALLWFYGGAGHESSQVIPGGYRVEIVYK